MKLTTNSLVIGNKTYNLEDSKYAFMDAGNRHLYGALLRYGRC